VGVRHYPYAEALGEPLIAERSDLRLGFRVDPIGVDRGAVISSLYFNHTGAPFQRFTGRTKPDWHLPRALIIRANSGGYKAKKVANRAPPDESIKDEPPAQPEFETRAV
jgi:hypothetical protein